MKVRFDRTALADIDEITKYLSSHNPKAAAELLSQFESAAKLLETVPSIGTPTERNDFRRLVIGNYLLVYRILPEETIIYYVRHGARRRPWAND